MRDQIRVVMRPAETDECSSVLAFGALALVAQYEG